MPEEELLGGEVAGGGGEGGHGVYTGNLTLESSNGGGSILGRFGESEDQPK